jgi:hypothetical protein
MGMTRRRRLAVFAVLAVVGLGAVKVALRPWPRPCRETFEQVREGMTREEVLATVGDEPDWRRCDPYAAGGVSGEDRWYGPGDTLRVWYDTDGRVLSPRLCHQEPTFIDYVRRVFDLKGSVAR